MFDQRRGDQWAGLGLAVLLTAPAVGADAGHHHSVQTAHVHGVASLDVAVEGQGVHLGLRTPAGDWLGFEHAPSTDAERAELERVLTTAKDGLRLFRLSPTAQCALSEVAVTSELADHQMADPKGTEPGQLLAHGELAAEYRFVCQRSDQLTWIEALVFEVFPGTTRIRVQWVGPRGQGGAELTPAHRRIGL